ncbi:MAG: acetate--CoA ligase family protein [Deltaproteobacteria bacterium]|nr:acetate--CoA ligase family protein [Candidatus Anaeroferrophillus wilburensis]MBN2889445.1 acetate--CoA ligase family protein [Deltaproteobacteria bacterium]
MEKLFHPRSVLVIGVSPKPENLAKNIVHNLIDFGFEGEIHLLGRKPGYFLGHRIHTEFADLPDGIEMAVILTPAATVLATMKACVAKGITRMVIESGGFREFSAAGAVLEKEIVAFASQHGVKFVGPNGISIINRHNGLCLPFMRLSSAEIREGGLSLVSQSGGMALTYLGMGSSDSLGVAKVVSMGNKSCLDESDYLAYLKDDPRTTIIGLYLEGIEDGQRLLSQCAGIQKPVILHKANTSEQSGRIARSHTAALANDDQVVDAACRQYGIYRVKTFRQFINQVKSFSLPLMRGDNLVVISRSGGHAVVAADAAAAAGFQLVEFSDEFIDFIKSRFRAKVINPTNPLDLGDLFDIDFYVTILEQVLQRPDVDGVLFNHVFQADVEGDASLRLAETINILAQRYHKPVALCVFSGEQAVTGLKRKLSFPLFTEPAEGIEALAVSRDYASRRQPLQQPMDEAVVAGGGDRQAVAAIFDEALSCQHGELLLDQVLEIFQAYDLPVLPYRIVRPGDNPAPAAAELGFPLAAKVVAAALSHKSDAGGVILGIDGPEAVRQTCAELEKNFASLPGYRGIMLQSQGQTSLEMIVGGRQDAAFGPVVLLGMGGIYAEIFQDVALRLPPLTSSLIDDMIAELKGAPILMGARGRQGVHRPTLEKVLQAVAGLLTDFPVIQQLDINPLFLDDQQGAVVDGRIILAAAKA